MAARAGRLHSASETATAPPAFQRTDSSRLSAASSAIGPSRDATRTARPSSVREPSGRPAARTRTAHAAMTRNEACQIAGCSSRASISSSPHARRGGMASSVPASIGRWVAPAPPRGSTRVRRDSALSAGTGSAPRAGAADPTGIRPGPPQTGRVRAEGTAADRRSAK
ncbi:hypothetical protein GCM10010466_32980 [Planomonospora alba]|uniref:Uncharacterized protein n=1 Tax=Planomonospora alba TaxID=161354 RepID=A0ABP6N856_9ACTN